MTELDSMFFEKARVNMVKNQLLPLGLDANRLLEAFLMVPREYFVAEKHRAVCYADEDYTANSHLMLRPELLFKSLYLLELKETDSVLVIAAGLGYVAAILSHVVKNLLVVEDEKESFTKLSENISSLKLKNITLKTTNTKELFFEEAPFDKIIINSLTTHVPDMIVSQLGYNGKLLTFNRNASNNEVAPKLISNSVA